MKKSGYVIQADVIRIVAIVGVVLVHLVYFIYARPDFLGGTTWWVANLLNALAHTAVPLFVMLSGYLLLPKKEAGSLMQRIGRRLVIPMFSWYAIYLYWNTERHNQTYTFFEILTSVFKSNMFHMYFLVILIGLYALIPMLQEYVIPHAKRLKTTIVLSMVIGFLMYIAPYSLTPNETQYNSFTIWIPYLGYFLLGYWFKTHSVNRKLLLLLFGGSYLGTVALGYLNVFLRSKSIEIFWSSSGVSYFDEYLSPNMIIMSVTLFPLLLRSGAIGSWAKSRFMVSLISVLASASFAVYLIHSIVIDKIDIDYGFALEFLEGPLLPYFLIRTSLIIAVSFIAAIIAVRIPYLQMLFGIWPTKKK